MKKRYLIFLLLLKICACNPKSNNGALDEGFELSNGVLLKKLDSIQIDFAGNPTVHDIDPESGTVLFMEHKEFSEDISIADFEGNILSSFSKFGDMPDTYGKLMSTIKINGPNSFLVYGYRGFLTYDFNGKLLSLVKYDDFNVPSESMRAMGFGMENLSNKFLYINQEPRPTEVHQYKDHKILSLIDPVGGKRNTIIGFPENSIFLNGNYFFSASWFPVFTHDEDHIYVAFGSEPVIYIYDAKEPYSLKSSITLNFPGYNYFKGSDNPNDIKNFIMPIISGKIENIKLVGEHFLIAYFPGYDALDIETSLENKSPEEAKIFRERMGKKYPPRIAIIDSAGKVINDYIPEGLEPRSMLLRNGELWMMEKPDEEVEQDFFRLFRVGLKIEN